MEELTIEGLTAEVERLRSKLSPLEDKGFTETMAPVLKALPLAALDPYLSKHKGVSHVVIRPVDMWDLLFPDTGFSTLELAKLGRSLQALGWVRSARRGNLVFMIPTEEL